MWYYNGFWGMNVIWWIIWILFIIWLFATPWGYRRNTDSSYEILRRRYAAGEITKEEYLEAKSVLEEKFDKIRKDNAG